MPPNESMNSRKPVRRLRQVTPVKANAGSVPPLFLTFRLRKAIERLLPDRHHQRMHQYFEKYGCLRCSRKNVLYAANGFCMGCINMIGKRMRKVDRELRARKPVLPPKLEENYLRPYNSARRLLADLMPKIVKGKTRKKPEPKFPPKVYMRF